MRVANAAIPIANIRTIPSVQPDAMRHCSYRTLVILQLAGRIMTNPLFRSGAIAGAVAAVSMSATPAMAVDIPVPAAPAHDAAPAKAYDGEAENADRHRRWRRGWRHRNRVDAGDVIAGIAIIGGIAAIASAANRGSRDRRYRERDYRYRDQRPDYRDQRRDDRRIASQGRGMSGAVDMCVEQVERGEDRVSAVDNASRTADGWRVSGSLENGGGFSCWIDNQGRIRNIDLGGQFSESSYGSDYPARDNQYSDDYYRSARADLAYGG